MKTCPICGAKAFDDASTCYGCLHSFDFEESSSEPRNSSPSGMPLKPEQHGAFRNAPDNGSEEARRETFGEAALLITLTPRRESPNRVEWACSVKPCRS